MEENQERQQDELSTLESICGENEFSYSIIDKVPVSNIWYNYYVMFYNTDNINF